LISIGEQSLAEPDILKQFFILLEIFVEKVEEVRRVEGDGVEALELWMKSGKWKTLKTIAGLID
jgi:hypothetical protein